MLHFYMLFRCIEDRLQVKSFSVIKKPSVQVIELFEPVLPVPAGSWQKEIQILSCQKSLALSPRGVQTALFPVK